MSLGLVARQQRFIYLFLLEWFPEKWGGGGKAKLKSNLMMRRLRPSHTHCANQKPNGSVETNINSTNTIANEITSPVILCLLLLCFLFLPCQHCFFWAFFSFIGFMIDGFGDALLRVRTQAVLICTASCRKTHHTGAAEATGQQSVVLTFSRPAAADGDESLPRSRRQTSNNQESDR